MNDADIEKLAGRAGVAVEWTDYLGAAHRVAPPTLQRILAALRLPCEAQSELSHSLHLLDEQDRAATPAALTGIAGAPLALGPGMAIRRGEIRLEEGGVLEARDIEAGGALPPIAAPGRHRLHSDAGETTLLVAPPRCIAISDMAPGERLFGLAAQIYALARPGDCGVGDMGGVAALARRAAFFGADALALSPNHALFFADSAQYSPYAPSSRLFYNPLYADPAALFGAEAGLRAMRRANLDAIAPQLERSALIDYGRAAPAKAALLRALYDEFARRRAAGEDGARAADFESFRCEEGDPLEHHATFEALHAARLAVSAKDGDWRAWPDELRRPDSAAVAGFAKANAAEVEFHAFLQWLADDSAAAAQRAAREAGMRIGLVSDLAVGMSQAGSHAWSRQDDVLVGLQIGAPPDLINREGQNWGLTGFSPRALRESAFEPFAATLRASMRRAGGIRIDHVMGLSRLWLIPDGASAQEGAYLSYPFDDLARVIALESLRRRAIVVAEDLGTVPYGFRGQLESLAIYGMNILWFERWHDRFKPRAEWPRFATAMTSTHDLPTLAGWWAGHDLKLRQGLGLDDEAAARAAGEARAVERAAIWSTVSESESAPPAPENGAAFADRALAFVAGTPAELALFPLEDVLALEEQPNLPGTRDEHPNWRRRQAPDALGLEAPSTAARLAAIAKGRKA